MTWATASVAWLAYQVSQIARFQHCWYGVYLHHHGWLKTQSGLHADWV